MEFLVDTCVVIEYFLGKEPSRTVFRRLLQENAVYFSALTVFELCIGIEPDTKREEAINTLFEIVKVFPFDTNCAKKAGAIERMLRSKGKTIGPGDTMIAATGLAHDLPVLTLNDSHFKRVDGLKVISVENMI